MRPKSSRALRAALLAVALTAAARLSGQEAAAPPAPLDRAEIERRGARIGEVEITVDNVFDLNNPEEDKKLYRWANHVHVRTRANVIESALLFASGDRYEQRLLDESARALRARGFLADATVEPLRYDAATNTVDVAVHVRDAWSLSPDLRLGRSGGENSIGIGISDGNLLGTGKELNLFYKSDVDRDERYVGYSDPNVLNSHMRLHTVLGSASDGHRRELTAERPFYELDARWSLGGSVRDERRVDSMYDLGEEVDEFRHDLRSFTLQGGWSRGAVERHAQRWLVGITEEQDRFFPTPDTPQPLLLPEDRKLVYPWIGWQSIRDDYREMTELNDMGRTEDISLGLNLLATLGYAAERFGSDRDAWLLRAAAAKGWEPAAGRLLLFNAAASTRREDVGARNTVVAATGRYYVRNFDRNLLSVTVDALATHDLDAESQVLLGGDNGLRGYPLRYQSGTRRASVSVEERFFTDWYPWRLFRLGYAVFADAGRVTGMDPRGTPSLGTLYDVGVGLRLSSPRSSGRSIVHVDLAFPLNGDPSIDHVQLVVQTKGTF